MKRVAVAVVVALVLCGCVGTPEQTVDWSDVNLQCSMIRSAAVSAIVLANDPVLAQQLLAISTEVLELTADPNVLLSDIVVRATENRLDARQRLILNEAVTLFSDLYVTPPTLQEYIGADNYLRFRALWMGIQAGAGAVVTDTP